MSSKGLSTYCFLLSYMYLLFFPPFQNFRIAFFLAFFVGYVQYFWAHVVSTRLFISCLLLDLFLRIIAALTLFLIVSLFYITRTSSYITATVDAKIPKRVSTETYSKPLAAIFPDD